LFVIIKNKTIDADLDVLVLYKKGTPELFTDMFALSEFKLTNKYLMVSKKNEFGTADPNAIELEYKELKYIYNSNFVKWEFFLTILDFKDYTKPYYFPYEDEMKMIKKADFEKLKKSYLV
jgi:hypothetical protein